MLCRVSFTRAEVALVLNVRVSTPPERVYVPMVVVPDSTTLPEAALRLPRLPLAPKTSSTLAVVWR